MALDHSPANRAVVPLQGLSLALALLVNPYACAAPAAALAAQPAVAAVPQAAALEATPVGGAAAAANPVEAVLAYAERVRALPAPELAQEINRLGEGGDSAVRLTQLALALAQSKVPANTLRAQAVLQRVLGQNDEESRLLHPLARLISHHVAEARRSEEQLEKIERQTAQLRDAQRRIDQLNERLEAVRAIERSLPSRPAASAAPAAAASGPARP